MEAFVPNEVHHDADSVTGIYDVHDRTANEKFNLVSG